MDFVGNVQISLRITGNPQRDGEARLLCWLSIPYIATGNGGHFRGSVCLNSNTQN